MSADVESLQPLRAKNALWVSLLFFVCAAGYVLLTRASDEPAPLFSNGVRPERILGSAVSGSEADDAGPILRHNLFVSDSQARWRPDPSALPPEMPELSREGPDEMIEAVLPPPEPPPALPPPEPRRIQVRYAGVVQRLDGHRRAMLEAPSSGGQILLQEGDRFENFQVERIDRGHLFLTRDGEQFSLPLNTVTTLEAP